MSNNGNRLVGKRIADRYCITGEIGKGGMGVVYKAIPFDDPSHSVAIKVIQRTGRLGYDDLMRFQKEASLMSQLHHPNIVVFHELGLFGRDQEDEDGLGAGYYIVMEIADGTNLKESLARDGRKDLAYFFQVGLQVSTALDYTHGKNIIHRDIKPHNIIVGQAWRDQRGVLVKVLDFGIARLAEAMNAPGKDGVPQGFEEAAGTPLYMAPEQTSLMQAPVDHRIDLYSLGCVLYEILAGKPPFTANSRDKLEKQHVFAEAEPLTNLRPDIPPLVEKIVHKLLAKHPNDRYQTAFALHADLMRAKTLFAKGSRSPSISFPLGLKDRFQAVSAQLALVGRDRELETLTTEYDSVAKDKGRSRLTLVRGVAGIGKSRLMAEFQTYLARRKVRFVSGQFSQHENSLPFNALANAFNEYLHRLLKSHPHEAEELRRRIKTTLGPVAHRIAEIVPGLKPYLLGVPEEEVLQAETVQTDLTTNNDAFATFAKAFSDFTKCLGTDNQPIVFLFHDLHWADDKSLDLIDAFFTNANSLRFYLVVSQRSGMHHTNARFSLFLEKFRKLKRRYSEVELESITHASITGIVGNMLSSASSVTDELVVYLQEQSKGNPMHLVELTRTLVARDLIYPKPNSNQWDYDLKALRVTQVQLNTIDLILSRIQEYGEFDRQLLEIAATIGFTFQFEILLLGGRAQSVPVMKAVQRAMDEGLIVRVTDDPDLRHLGKTFMFAHKKARDAIYDGMEPDRRRLLHQAIGEKLEAAVPKPSETILFALAHHFNSALGTGGQTKDKALAERCLRANKLAGTAAYKSGSWQTAERYYENAWRLMGQWQGVVASPLERALVWETLADLAAVQKRHGHALQVYRELLSQKLPAELHAAIAYKAIYFQLVGGVMSETSKLLASTLRLIRRPVPVLNFLTKLSVYWSIATDMLPINYRKKRLYRALTIAHARRTEDGEQLDRRFPAIRLYLVATQLHLRDQTTLTLLHHDLALKEALAGRASTASAIKAVGERAALIGYLGGQRTAYRFLDMAMDVARAANLSSVYGYVALLRVLTLDYVKGRHEEISDHLKEAMAYLRPNEERLAYGLGLLFKIFRELTRCNFTGLYAYSLQMPDTIPTRNWLAPRSVAMMLYGYLLQGSRDSIVRHGEMFLKRRHKVAGRGQDLFVNLILTLIAFARGEIDKTRESYLLTMQDFIGEGRGEFYFPFEEDFIGLFAFTFPVLFEQEYGRHLMRTQEMAILLVRLKRRIKTIKGSDRTVPLLLRARVEELLGEPKNVRLLYDQALKSSQVGGNNLVQIFAYLWFGTHLLDHAPGQKRDYIRRAYALAGKLELQALVDHTAKLMEKRQIRYVEPTKPVVSREPEGQAKPPAVGGKSRLYIEHLHHICEAIAGDSDWIDDLRTSLAILARHYTAGRVYCIVSDENGVPQVLLATDRQIPQEQVLAYIEPYFNIRSTLFLPLSDAPWSRSDDAAQEMGETPGQSPAPGAKTELPATGAGTPVASATDTPGGNVGSGTSSNIISSSGVSAGSSSSDDAQGQSAANGSGGLRLANLDITAVSSDRSFDGNSTIVMPGSDGAGGEAQSQLLATANTLSHTRRSVGSQASGGGRLVRTMQMSALLPLRTAQNSSGVLLLEDIGNIHGRDTNYCRADLDQFGVQLALMLERKHNRKSVSVTKTEGSPRAPVAAYESAAYSLEPVPWLKLWQFGRLRAQRETSWFLGLNFGPGIYVIAYCMLSGNDSVRERIGAMLWHQMHVIRALIVASGRRQVEVAELQEEFSGFFSGVNRTAQLESISLAFSVFSRTARTVNSGHFGPSRPFVVGAENIVSPHNDVVLTYAHGRDLRFWDVSCEISGPHAYMLSYDTSKLDALPGDSVQKRVALSLAQIGNADELHRVLGSLVAEGNLPRYYLAAMLKEAAEMELEPGALPPLAKAE